MFTQRRILVPLGRSVRDLTGIHYALSLARRLQAQIYILQQAQTEGTAPSATSAYINDALSDLINSARQMGLVVFHHIANVDMKQEIVELVKEESIGFLVFSVDDIESRHFIREIKSLVSSQIIQVKNQKPETSVYSKKER